MRRFAVAAVLLACMLGLAAAASNPSLPRSKTGGISCTKPITRMTCVLDKKSSYVMGIRFGDPKNTASSSVCGSSSAFTYNQVLNFQQGDQPDVTAANQTRFVVSKLEIMKSSEPESRGKIPAIRVYLWDTLPEVNDVVGYVVCGNTQLEEDDELEVAQTLEAPEFPDDDSPKFLAQFTAKCSKKNLTPNPTNATWFVLSLEKLCWTKAINYGTPLGSPPADDV